jgi:hypothetical protein
VQQSSGIICSQYVLDIDEPIWYKMDQSEDRHAPSLTPSERHRRSKPGRRAPMLIGPSLSLPTLAMRPPRGPGTPRPPIPLITEGGEPIATEAGDIIVQEQD